MKGIHEQMRIKKVQSVFRFRIQRAPKLIKVQTNKQYLNQSGKESTKNHRNQQAPLNNNPKFKGLNT